MLVVFVAVVVFLLCFYVSIYFFYEAFNTHIDVHVFQ